MSLMTEFTLISQKQQISNAVIYHGYRNSDKRPVTVKIFTNENLSDEDESNLQHEYQLMSELNGSGTLAVYGIEHDKINHTIVVEDFCAESIKDLLKVKELSIEEFLQIAIKITEALEVIHEHNIIHKNINSGSILWDKSEKQVKIISFNIATKLPREEFEISNVKMLEGDLSYISPEQTGRMNRGIDYRSDFYSLGVVFFEMLTGQTPFKTKDPLELVHCLIAKIPIPPHNLNPRIPQTLSNIIMKLLAKTPEERYQSIYGLKVDLRSCLEQLKIKENVKETEFIIGRNDITSRFHISEKIYGRENEIKSLMKTFRRVSKGIAELLLVTGYSGVGKSRLIHEIHKPVINEHGYFIPGKFEQFRRNTPYIAIIQAFETLVQQIATESDNRINEWKKAILDAVGSNGQIIVEIVPSLVNIIGPQPPIEKLGAVESLNRFNLTLQNFVQSLASPKSPLVIFLDDLQWADLSSLNIIESLLKNPDIKNILFIGSYRDNEVESTHPLLLTLETLQNYNLHITSINIKPLQLDDVEQLLTDTLHMESNKIKPLATICIEKTRGNPFFLNQFLQTLHKEHVIIFDEKQGKWVWDDTRVQSIPYTDNVGEFMANKIYQLPVPTQKILQFAACLGNRFDLKTLIMASQQTAKDAAKNLWLALVQGIIIPLDNNYKFIEHGSNKNTVYQFSHDRIQQAVYSLIEKQDIISMHFNIGKLLLHNTSSQTRGEKIIEIVNHINQGIRLISKNQEKIELAELNFIASKKASASNAYPIALNYLKIAIELLPADAWEVHYELTLKLYSEATEIAYLASQSKDMERFARTLLANAESPLDKLNVYKVKIAYLTNQHKLPQAVETGLEAMKLLGIDLPVKASKATLIFELLRNITLISNKRVERFESLPLMKDKNFQAAHLIMSQIGSSVYLTNPDLFVIIILQAARIMLRYGISNQSPVFMESLGIICIALGKIETGIRYGQLGLRLIEKLDNTQSKPIATLVFYTFLAHWTQDINEILLQLKINYQNALELGNLEYAGYSAGNYIAFCSFSGKSLKNINDEAEKYSKALMKISQRTAYQYMSIHRGFAAWLLETKDDKEKSEEIINTWINKEKNLSTFLKAKNNSALTDYYLLKSFANYLLEDYTQAYNYIRQGLKHAEQLQGSIWYVLYCFYEAILSIANYKSIISKYERRRLNHRIKKILNQYKQFSQQAPKIYRNKYYLILAEYNRVFNNGVMANEYYDQAIILAKENGFIHEEALANECSAKFFMEQGKITIARTYMINAYYCYIHWGAFRKAHQLEEKYSQLLDTDIRFGIKKISTITQSLTRSLLVNESLDLIAILKASRTIAKEIVLSKLLREIIRIVIQIAGAQKGYLLLKHGDQYLIEAKDMLDNQPVILKSALINEELSSSVISYVVHTKETLIIDDAVHDTRFLADAYINNQQTKSILCVPILKQNTLAAILYLENNLTTSAFTNDHKDTLDLLSSQIAISLEISHIYQASQRFVPKNFLELLHKRNINEIELGDASKREITILFNDIRSFTTLVEYQTPEEAFAFVNRYWKFMAPIIRQYGGYIDLIQGDGLLAVFPDKPEDAYNAARAMRKKLIEFNQIQKEHGSFVVDMGIGISSGSVMLGIIGEKERYMTGIISDVTNTASRIEGLNKVYHTHVLLSAEAVASLLSLRKNQFRRIDKVRLIGKTLISEVYESIEWQDEFKDETGLSNYLELFDTAYNKYTVGDFSQAIIIFNQCLEKYPNDTVVRLLKDRCESFLKTGAPTDWAGITTMTSK